MKKTLQLISIKFVLMQEIARLFSKHTMLEHANQ